MGLKLQTFSLTSQQNLNFAGRKMLAIFVLHNTQFDTVLTQSCSQIVNFARFNRIITPDKKIEAFDPKYRHFTRF